MIPLPPADEGTSTPSNATTTTVLTVPVGSQVSISLAALPVATSTATPTPPPASVSPAYDEKTIRRFWSKVDASKGLFACWRWKGLKTADGYPSFFNGRKNVRAHRFAYELVRGAIPAGLVIDHVAARGCTRRDCVNVLYHLEAVTQAVNLSRIRRKKGNKREGK